MEYGVTILLSEPLVRACNPPFSRHFRPIDHVKLQGRAAPFAHVSSSSRARIGPWLDRRG